MSVALGRRPLTVALAASAFCASVFVTAAKAETHSVRVTLVTGRQLTTTVDVAPGTPVQQAQILGLPAPVEEIVDLGAVKAPAPPPTASPVETPEDDPTPGSSGSSQGSLPSAGDESPVNRRDSRKAVRRARDRREPSAQHPDGTPAQWHPRYSYATSGIPSFLLPIYRAAGLQHGIRWQILAAINEIETDYGRNLNISSAGAMGWMQFMPASWAAYGVDADGDGERDPYNPVDAIFAAARYLDAAGARTDIRRAVFAYNHADWYVDSVLMRAELIGGLPSELVRSLPGLTQGRFPVRAKATYAGRLTKSGHARRGIRIYSRAKAPIIAVSDCRVVELGRKKRLGRFLVLQDRYGNTYTYAHLGEVSPTYPTPTDPRRAERADRDLDHWAAAEAPPGLPLKQRLFANPTRPAVRAVLERGVGIGALTRQAPLGLDARDFTPKALRKGVRVTGGTRLGRLGTPTAHTAPYLEFEIRPAGPGAARIDPKPILDAWKLLESPAA